MDFDEYQYLEKTMEEREDKDSSKKKKGKRSHREIELDIWRYREMMKAVKPKSEPMRVEHAVFAQINSRATALDVIRFFSWVGKVKAVRQINKMGSKKTGYRRLNALDVHNSQECLFPYVSLLWCVEFENTMLVESAIARCGHGLLGQPVMVGPFEALSRTLNVWNLDNYMTETHLREIFEPYGLVENVRLPFFIGTNHCLGVGLIQFANKQNAEAAQRIHGVLKIAKRTLMVSSVEDHFRRQATTSVAGRIVGTPSNCLMFKNMFFRYHEKPGFEVGIKEYVEKVCSKHGTLKHIYVDKNSEGFVYVKFETLEAAVATQQALDLTMLSRPNSETLNKILSIRPQSNVNISVKYMEPDDYEARFGKL